MGSILEMANDRLYEAWGHLETALQTGQAQNKSDGDLLGFLVNDPEQLRQFIAAMGDVQRGNFVALAEQFDFSPYQTLCDIGVPAASYLSR